ncbi:MAG: NAD-dependent epimerase/dehydratase family protein [Phycisphaerae bacterium]
MGSSQDGERVLLTGVSGAVGRHMAKVLVEAGYAVVGLDLAPPPEPVARLLADFHAGDLADARFVEQAMASSKSVVHLAASPRVETPFDDLFAANYVGSVRVYEAAVRHKLRRVVVASSVHAAGGERRRPTDVEKPVRIHTAEPTSHYGLSKVWLEQAGGFFARSHDLSVVALRLGWFIRNPEEQQQLARSRNRDVYVSHDDAGRLFLAALRADVPPGRCVVAFGMSRQVKNSFDLTEAMQLQYEPQDVFPEGLRLD